MNALGYHYHCIATSTWNASEFWRCFDGPTQGEREEKAVIRWRRFEDLWLFRHYDIN
jgi:hypothetical protein